jgi:transposase-like protein
LESRKKGKTADAEFLESKIDEMVEKLYGVETGNRIYDLEFQKDALRLLYKRNGNISEVSKSLGIPYSTLKTWEIKIGKSIKQERA